MKVWIEKPVSETEGLKEGWYSVFDGLFPGDFKRLYYYNGWFENEEQQLNSMEYLGYNYDFEKHGGTHYLVPIEVDHVLTDGELRKINNETFEAGFKTGLREKTK